MTTIAPHNEMAKHIRNRIKKAGIKARVRMDDICGSLSIRVDVPAFGLRFTDDEQRTIRDIAKANGLTFIRGIEIDINEMTNPEYFVFVFQA